MAESQLLYNDEITLLGDSIKEFEPKNFTYFVKPTEYDMSEMRLEGLKKYAEIIQWGRKNPIKFCERFYGVEFLDFQKYVFMKSWITPFNVWCMSRSAGKALDLNTRIPTPNGDKIMRDIHVGDYVFDADGKPTRVTYESPIYYNHDCYEVTFGDGEKIIADAEHNWYVQCRNIRDKNKYRIKTTEQMLQNCTHVYGENSTKAGCREATYRVDCPKPLQYTKKDLYIPPYILGMWLGDGKADDGYIICSELDLDETCKNIISTGCSIYSINNDSGNCKRIRIHLPDGTPLKGALRKLGVLGNKTIPHDYLYSNINDRIELLQGLMDTDGYITADGYCDFSQCTKHKDIAYNFIKLLDSLGIKSSGKHDRLKKYNGIDFPQYYIHFSCSKDEIPCFKLTRKLDRQKNYNRNKTNRALKKSITNIQKVDSRPVKCIQVESDSHLYLCGNKNTVTHNTTLGSPFLMAKTHLLPNFDGFILSGTGSQSIGMMKKIEAIAKKEISSFTGLTDVFMNEIVKAQANTTGFIHAPNSWSYKLYNGSSLATVNSNYNGSRGRRSRCNFYDESAFIPEELFVATLPFLAQNSDFALGGDIDIELIPPNFQNQVIYASSAGSTDDTFFKRYKEFSLHMMAGDKRYFCADLDCNVVMNATYNGKKYPVPLLTQEKIDSEMKMNPLKATREYMNKFDTELGEGQIIRKSQIIKNSFVRPPKLFNNSNKGMFSLAYDPARKKDNSVITVGEFVLDNNKGWMMNIVNCINLVDITKKKRHPKTTPEQIVDLKQLILDYNGVDTSDYECIRHVLIDAGTGGGGGTSISDGLFEDWYEQGHNGDNSYLHRGLIDKTYSEEYLKQYPNAVRDKLLVLEPTKYKVELFLALIEMIEQDLITFTAEYDYHGYLTLLDNENDEAKTYKLTLEEEEHLKQIDLLKEEAVHMYRYKSSNGRDRFDLAQGLENTIGDDRVYTLALLAWDLQQLRRSHITNKKRPKKENIAQLCPVKKATIRKTFM